ncbi:carboxypeptidase-like regulatory domain-containing protein [Mangrovivirga cuniculi]|uniref:carboxypeptidase-like regulatory domain-containing protein n=1 Tax=Mangrovivirga cuniculi TaxID=2715131 RepID=UPI001C2F97F1|nr:carboxypeptidase-like regulatory domain-containing protein [Mangrovivirga cuniculi]
MEINKKALVFFLCITLHFFSTIEVLSQQKGEIGGRVIDAKSGEPLIGVSVILEGTSKGAVTDINGYYLIKTLIQSRITLRHHLLVMRKQ